VRTVREYGYNLAIFSRFLDQQNIADFQSITAAIVTGFMRWLFYQPTKRGAARGVLDQNRTLAAVKGFFRFLKAEGYLVRDPAEPIEYAREPRRLPRSVLTPKEAQRILAVIDTSTALGYRDRAMLEVLYVTGIRREELRQLRVEDVHLEEGLLHVRGKGGHERMVPLGKLAASILETYLKGIRPQLLGAKSTDRLFLSFKGNPIDAHTLGDLVGKYAALAKIKKHVTLHVWRHSCATHMIRNNANLRHVQEMLGHRSLSTTERYLHLTVTDLKEAHRKFHPREKQKRAPGLK
jgi:integrase/recombinase XerD